MSNPETNEIFMKIHLSEQESKFAKFQNKVKNILFNMFFILLKDKKSNLLIECLSLLVQYMQILYYPFDGYVKIKKINYIIF
jgi:hypothetical protein